jgi:hypothetical protein
MESAMVVKSSLSSAHCRLRMTRCHCNKLSRSALYRQKRCFSFHADCTIIVRCG